MNQTIKKKWVAALRSGRYQQGRKALRRGNQNGTRYCCLGVLSDLAVKEGVCSNREAFKGNSTLNRSVSNWAGITYTDNPTVDGASLTSHNDGERDIYDELYIAPKSFKQIAVLIQKYL